MNRDVACGTVTLIIAIAYYLAATAIPASLLADAVGPGGLPKAYAWALGILSLLLIGRAFVTQPAPREEASVRRALPSERTIPEPVRPHPAMSFRQAAVMLAIGAAYILALPWIGYALGVGLLILTTVFYQSGKREPSAVLVAAAGAVLFWAVFVLVLDIPEPVGFWPALLGF